MTLSHFFILSIISLFLCSCSPQTKSKVVYHQPERHPSKIDLHSSPSSAVEKEIFHFYTLWAGTPHRIGGMSRKGIDCSGLVQITFKQLFKIDLPRSTKGLSKIGSSVSKSHLKPGDLIFFKTGIFSRHVGLFYKDNLFIHASEKRGVIISNLNEKYWSSHFWKASRISPLLK